MVQHKQFGGRGHTASLLKKLELGDSSHLQFKQLSYLQDLGPNGGRIIDMDLDLKAALEKQAPYILLPR